MFYKKLWQKEFLKKGKYFISYSSALEKVSVYIGSAEGICCLFYYLFKKKCLEGKARQAGTTFRMINLTMRWSFQFNTLRRFYVASRSKWLSLGCLKLFLVHWLSSERENFRSLLEKLAILKFLMSSLSRKRTKAWRSHFDLEFTLRKDRIGSTISDIVSSRPFFSPFGSIPAPPQTFSHHAV